MVRRLVVLSLLAAMVAALGMTATFAEDYPSWSYLSPKLDAEAHANIGGPNGKNFITSGELYDYIQGIGKKIGCTHQIYLVRNDQFNACASVSRIYIYTGLTTRCANADEVAFAIGHEMKHIENHHLEFAYDDQVNQARQLDMQIGSMNRKGNEQAVKIAKGIAKIGLKLSSLHISRENEFDADIGSAVAIKKAGLSVEKAEKLFDRMGAGPKGTIGGWMATHPAPRDRIARLIAGMIIDQEQQSRMAPLKQAASQSSRINAVPFAQMVSTGDFAGYAHLVLSKDGPFYLLTKSTGIMTINGRSIILPAGTKEVIFFLSNPKPENAISIRIHAFIGTNKDVAICNEIPEACSEMAVKVPVSALTNADQVDVEAVFSKSPVPRGTTITIDTVKLFAFRSRFLSFRN